MLSRFGLSPPSRRGRKGYGSRLSPRELEVVRLVASGRTNRQIADALYLSPRTVAHHLTSTMRKLEVTSRTALAVAALTQARGPATGDAGEGPPVSKKF